MYRGLTVARVPDFYICICIFIFLRTYARNKVSLLVINSLTVDLMLAPHIVLLLLAVCLNDAVATTDGHVYPFFKRMENLV